MNSRQAGRRMAGKAARQKKSAKRVVSRQAVRKQDKVLSARERRQLIQLVICGSIFVLLVAAKLLIPGHMEQIHAKISGAMEQNMDVQSVFSAVGRAFTGQSELSSAADEVYWAVFHPGESIAVETALQIPDVEESAALDILRDHRAKQNLELMDTETEPGQTEAESLAYVLYSNQTLPEGVSMEQAILGFDYCTPVSGSISSDFGYRDHPTEGEERFHYGLDLAAETGTDISCFADGTVTAVGESSSYGKYCIIAHESGYSTLYAHCSRITVSSGATVQKGEKIAEVGETGLATGPHLHFELQCDGTYLNPIYYVSAL